MTVSTFVFVFDLDLERTTLAAVSDPGTGTKTGTETGAGHARGARAYTNARIHSGIFHHHGWREASGETERTPPVTIPLESLGRRTP